MNLSTWLKQNNIFYGWVIVFICFFVIAFAFGVRLSFGIFFEALTRGNPENGIVPEFTWTRADTAGVFSVSMVVFTLTSTIFGWMLDCWGPRKVFILGILVMSSGLYMTSRIQTLFQFTLYYGIWTGLGITILGLAIHAATLSRWFEQAGRRGLAIGLAFSGTGVGILILAPVLERIITLYGWRNAYLFLAVLLLVIALPLVLLLLRDTPEQLGLFPDGNSSTQTASAFYQTSFQPTPSGVRRLWTFRSALQTSIFWLIMIGGLCSLFTLRMVSVHQVAHFVDKGVTRLTAATVYGSAGFITALAFIVFGSLSDRIGRPKTFYVGSCAQVLALLLLIGLWHDPPTPYLYTVAFFWGIGEGSRSSLLTAIANDTFPGTAQGTIVGALGTFFGLGSALGSWFGGVVYDYNGSYLLAFAVALFATLAATFCIFLVQRYSDAAFIKFEQ